MRSVVLRSGFRGVCGVMLVTALMAGFSMQADALVNGDFETGDFTGWTIYTDVDGTLGDGMPVVSMYDTDGDTVDSLAAEFNVGHTQHPWGFEGGDIYQALNMVAGDWLLEVDIATQSERYGNAEGGYFSLLFDNVVVDSFQFGEINGGIPYYGSLSASLVGVGAGLHEVGVHIARDYTSSDDTPHQHVDNVSLTLEGDPQVPDAASTVMLLGAALAGLATIRRKF